MGWSVYSCTRLNYSYIFNGTHRKMHVHVHVTVKMWEWPGDEIRGYGGGWYTNVQVIVTRP